MQESVLHSAAGPESTGGSFTALHVVRTRVDAPLSATPVRRSRRVWARRNADAHGLPDTLDFEMDSRVMEVARALARAEVQAEAP